MFREPIGFSIDRVWSIDINPHLPWKTHKQEKLDGMNQLVLLLRNLPEIESVGGISLTPYSNSASISQFDHNGRTIEAYINQATDNLKEVLSVDMTAGRWFGRDDDAGTAEPAIINERLARDLFGSNDPLGKELPVDKYRVIGVVKDFRKAGEFSQPVNYLISRIRTVDTTARNIVYTILIRLKPGVTAAFQEQLVKKMQAAEKRWTFDVVQLDHEREKNFKLHLAPLIAGGVIAGFLLFMVTLGLIGVLWQNVSQRTKEIGLRRALGGTAQNVSRQIHGEQFIITTIGVLAGSLLAMQLPLINLIDFIPAEIYVTALLLSLVLMYVITYLCSMFPSWLAMEIEPAEALHYE